MFLLILGLNLIAWRSRCSNKTRITFLDYLFSVRDNRLWFSEVVIHSCFVDVWELYSVLFVKSKLSVQNVLTEKLHLWNIRHTQRISQNVNPSAVYNADSTYKL